MSPTTGAVATLDDLTVTTTVETRLGRLAVHRVGEPGAPTAVLWHSMFVDATSWVRMVPLLAPHRTLLVVDGPGYGRSDPLRHPTEMAACAEAAVELLDALGVMSPVDWLGNAWGGHVGFQLVGTRPERLRSLVAVSSPALPLSPDLMRQVKILGPVLRALGPIAPLRRLLAEIQLTDATRSHDPAAVQCLVDALRRPGRRSLANTLTSFIARRTDLEPALAGSAVPTLLVATEDRGELTPEAAAATAAKAGNTRVATITDARTLVPLEQPRALADLVIDFWSSPVS